MRNDPPPQSRRGIFNTNKKTPGARLLIDGYNLIGVQHPDLEKERAKMLGLLQAYRKNTGHELTVVFDGWRDGSHLESRLNQGGVNVIYSRLGEKADLVIKKILEKETGLILISSDRELQGAAWAHDSVAVSSGLFEKKLLSAGSGPLPEALKDQEAFEEEEDEDSLYSSNPGRTGNGRQVSKRQRALERALKRL